MVAGGAGGIEHGEGLAQGPLARAGAVKGPTRCRAEGDGLGVASDDGPERRGHRNGSRDRLLATPAGDIQLRLPRFRTGSFFPSLLEPRRRVDRALWAVVMEAYVSGVSTRKVDELVVAPRAGRSPPDPGR